MPSLAYFLDRTRQLSESISSLKFSSSGIFTNSFIRKPPITRLLKDAAEHEQALYTTRRVSIYTDDDMEDSQMHEESPKIQGQSQIAANPERIDGKSYYIDYSFNDYTNLSMANPTEATAQGTMRTAVRIPEVIHDQFAENRNEKDGSSSPSKSQSKMVVDSLIEGNNVEEMCEYVLHTIKKYPNIFDDEKNNLTTSDLVSSIVKYHDQYIDLRNEIDELEEVVNEQRKQLQFFNVSIGDRSPILLLQSSQENENKKSQANSNEDEDEVNVDELIRQEEEEIRLLEEALTIRQKET